MSRVRGAVGTGGSKSFGQKKATERKKPQLHEYIENRDYTGAMALLEFQRNAGESGEEELGEEDSWSGDDAGAPADLVALLAQAGLAEHTDAFVADGYDDVAYLQHLAEADTLDEELSDLGLTAAQLAMLRASLTAPPAAADDDETPMHGIAA